MKCPLIGIGISFPTETITLNGSPLTFAGPITGTCFSFEVSALDQISEFLKRPISLFLLPNYFDDVFIFLYLVLSHNPFYCIIDDRQGFSKAGQTDVIILPHTSLRSPLPGQAFCSSSSYPAYLPDILGGWPQRSGLAGA